ncbi:hypothetical protein C1H76_2664 [Elsinoe australis]|uniref:Uncharacterized protein n=1 Tax=Elsinoe australis TaxID=40998 RepID=A0A4U7B1K4_9PEZI|nr:hypothetical protein C1H76_2664 [Elsinoe australis]
MSASLGPQKCKAIVIAEAAHLQFSARDKPMPEELQGVITRLKFDFPNLVVCSAPMSKVITFVNIPVTTSLPPPALIKTRIEHESMFIAREKGEPRSPLREASIYVLALRFHGMKQSGALMETAINNVNNAKPKTTKTIPPKIKAPAVPPREVVGTIVCRALEDDHFPENETPAFDTASFHNPSLGPPSKSHFYAARKNSFYLISPSPANCTLTYATIAVSEFSKDDGSSPMD